MKKLFRILACLLLLAATFSACKKEIKQEDPSIQLGKDSIIIKEFVAKNGITGVQQYLNSGLYYKIIEPGSGTGTYTSSSIIKANYTGRLLDGTVFDKTTSTPASFALGNVIPGWQVGVQLIRKGGIIRLFIPSGYAYGGSATNAIPANSVLDFDIELVDVQY